MGPNICIVIPTHDRNDLLQRTLDSLGQCERTNAPVRLYIVENGGKHGAESVARSAASWLNVQYRYSELPNKSRALNQLLDEISDDLVVFFDDDVRISPSTLIAYEVAAASCGPGAYFGGPMGVDYQTEPYPWIQEFLPPSAKGLTADQINLDSLDPFLGCNWAARAKDLRACGGFDVAIGPGATSGAVGQETDMQRRLTRSGIRPVLVPDAKVWHYVPEDRCSPEWALKRSFRNGVSAGIGKRPGPRWLMGYPPWVLKMFAKRALALTVTRCSPDPVKRFRASADFEHIRGRMHGVRISRSKRATGLQSATASK